MKLLGKMCKYKMDPTSIVGFTADTILSTDGQTDRRADKVKPVYPPFTFVEAGGIIMVLPVIWDALNAHVASL